MHDLARLQFDDEEGEKWTKEEVRYRQEIASPHVFCMMAQKGLPGLATRALWTDLLHLLLDRPFPRVDIQLEELTPNTLRTPQSIGRCHLLDQADRLGREPRLARMSL